MPLPFLRGPAKVDIAIDQGARFDQAFAWVQDNARVPLTGYMATAQIRVTPTGQLIMDLTPYLTIDMGDHTINLNIPASVTRQITRSGVWDLFVVNMGDPNDAERLVSGKATVRYAVTR